LEHPNLRPGHGAGDPPDHQARARQHVRISIRLVLVVASGDADLIVQAW
jgi:hypothetical protein